MLPTYDLKVARVRGVGTNGGAPCLYTLMDVLCAHSAPAHNIHDGIVVVLRWLRAKKASALCDFAMTSRTKVPHSLHMSATFLLLITLDF